MEQKTNISEMIKSQGQAIREVKQEEKKEDRKIIEKYYTIDWTKVQTIRDVIDILIAIDPKFTDTQLNNPKISIRRFSKLAE